VLLGIGGDRRRRLGNCWGCRLGRDGRLRKRNRRPEADDHSESDRWSRAGESEHRATS
jgi:hypothetical protein